ncbi:unnamed protein product [Prorocentrum cordatum]|uniref:Uncharacterized protein n=1 Tax=Prorocentrum cordatum TaxID=2364126 RepID=A0ABN9S0B4_9DINO|nr:unnamed protein product [Polarella glacialis]
MMTAASFSRIAQALGNWLIDLPLWGKAASVMKTDWAQAFLLCLTLPLILLLAVLCVANQQVRRARGISLPLGQHAVASRVSSTTDSANLAPPRDVSAGRASLHVLSQLLRPASSPSEGSLRIWLTARLNGVWQEVRGLRWLADTRRCTSGVCCLLLTMLVLCSSTQVSRS